MKNLFNWKKKDNALPPRVRACDHPGCAESGDFRAPKTRDQVGSNVHDNFHWFCLYHVREYNKSWNYFAGMNDVEAMQHASWSRPTWPIGRWSSKSKTSNKVNSNTYEDPFDLFKEDKGAGFTTSKTKRDNTEAKALATLGMKYPYSPEQLRVNYLFLVKKYHPDANNGSSEAEEFTKKVNEAYMYLKGKVN